MSAILSDAFRVEASIQMMNSLINTPSYIFIGKDSPWPDLNVPLPSNTITDQNLAVYDLIMAKKLTSGNMTLALNRVNWESGTIYSRYDVADASLFSARTPFYVLTSDNNVYKCLNNNNGQPSTIKPTSKSLTPFTLSDDYLWKYMFSIDTETADTYMTSQYIPVKLNPDPAELQFLVQEAAIKGSIESYIVRQGGAGYTSATVTITGDGIGAQALPVISGGQISKVLMVNSGSGYTYCNVTVSGNGSGAIVDGQPSPYEGHGAFAAKELGGHYLIMLSEFGGEDSAQIPKEFSFRKAGLLMNPEHENGTPYEELLISGTTKAYVNTTTGFVKGELVLYSDNSTAYVVNIGTDVGGKYFILSESKRISAGATIRKKTNTAVSATVSSAVQPSIAKHAGSVCYIENRNAIFKNETQTELVRIIIEF